LASNFPLTFNGVGVPNTVSFPLTFEALDFAYTLEFWDDNVGIDSYMTGTNFKVRNYMPTDGSIYPSTVKFTGTGVSFTLNISWQ
jgi:hypothetical protein